MQIRGIIFDIDGTLVDSNDAHAHAWVDALAEYNHHIPFEKVHPLIGMGGDKVLPTLLNISKDSDEGQKISQRRKQAFKEHYLSTLKAFPQTQELLQCLADHDIKMVIATSAEQDELDSLLQVIGPGADKFFVQETSSKDVKQSKPDPDVIEVALQKIDLPANAVVMIGDTAYDIEAAAKAGVKTIAFRSGGWKDKDLTDAIAVYDGPSDLLAHFDDSPLRKV